MHSVKRRSFENTEIILCWRCVSGIETRRLEALLPSSMACLFHAALSLGVQVVTFCYASTMVHQERLKLKSSKWSASITLNPNHQIGHQLTDTTLVSHELTPLQTLAFDVWWCSWPCQIVTEIVLFVRSGSSWHANTPEACAIIEQDSEHQTAHLEKNNCDNQTIRQAISTTDTEYTIKTTTTNARAKITLNTKHKHKQRKPGRHERHTILLAP